MSKISCSEIRAGAVLKYEGKIYKVLSSSAVTRGRATSFQVVEMRDIQDGRKNEHRFRVDDTVETAFIERVKINYSYQQGDIYMFMKQDTFEEISVDMSKFDFNYQFLTDNSEVLAEFCDGQLIGLAWPQKARAVCKVVETDAYIKGQTAKASGKSAVLDNGFKLNIPSHIEQGTKIVVDPGTGQYEGTA